jgi:hypothetical protein
MIKFNPTIVDSIGNYHLLKIQFPNQTIQYVLALYLSQKDLYTSSEFPYQILKISEEVFPLPSFVECEKLHQQLIK